MKQLIVEISHHGRTRARGRDDKIRTLSFKDVYEVFGHCARFGTITRIECHLTAACLRAIESNFDSQTTQRRHHCLADIGHKLIYETGYEEGGAQWVLVFGLWCLLFRVCSWFLDLDFRSEISDPRFEI